MRKSKFTFPRLHIYLKGGLCCEQRRKFALWLEAEAKRALLERTTPFEWLVIPYAWYSHFHTPRDFSNHLRDSFRRNKKSLLQKKRNCYIFFVWETIVWRSCMLSLQQLWTKTCRHSALIFQRATSEARISLLVFPLAERKRVSKQSTSHCLEMEGRMNFWCVRVVYASCSSMLYVDENDLWLWTSLDRCFIPSIKRFTQDSFVSRLSSDICRYSKYE